MSPTRPHARPKPAAKKAAPPGAAKALIAETAVKRAGGGLQVMEFDASSLASLHGLERHDLVERGVPVAVARQAMQSFDVIKPAEVLAVLGISEKTLQRRADTTLDSNASDRALRLFAVTDLAVTVLGDREAAQRWLCAPAVGLDRRRPIDLLSSSDGTDMVKTLLTRMEYGVYS